MGEAIKLLVGTSKGLFILRSDADRADWVVDGPHCDLWTINHAVGDPETGTIWAGGGSDWSGCGVWRSGDGGESWSLAKLAKGDIDTWAAGDADFAAMMNWTPTETAFDGEVETLWSLLLSNGTLYAGGKPGMLFRSEDRGESWEMVSGLSKHPDKENWSPGGAGLVLHSLVPDPADPAKLWAGISAAGIFATEDGGETWERRNRLSNAEACEGHSHPAGPSSGEVGLCVHNFVRSDGGGDILYQQNHHGVWRSSDGGRSWDDRTEGLPSTFGFPIRVSPHDPETIWTLPLNGDIAGRFPVDAAAAVWKSTDGGRSWQAKRDGLPQTACFFTVLRQAMATDRQPDVGVYFGTNSGSVFASADGGERWAEIAAHLPTIHSVEVLETD